MPWQETIGRCGSPGVLYPGRKADRKRPFPHARRELAESRGEISRRLCKAVLCRNSVYTQEKLWLQYPIEEEEIICQWLSQKKGQKVKIVVPKKGEKERLVELAARNADLILTQDT